MLLKFCGDASSHPLQGLGAKYFNRPMRLQCYEIWEDRVPTLSLYKKNENDEQSSLHETRHATSLLQSLQLYKGIWQLKIVLKIGFIFVNNFHQWHAASRDVAWHVYFKIDVLNRVSYPRACSSDVLKQIFNHSTTFQPTLVPSPPPKDGAGPKDGVNSERARERCQLSSQTQTPIL